MIFTIEIDYGKVMNVAAQYGIEFVEPPADD
jgi:hypothetical protein